MAVVDTIRVARLLVFSRPDDARECDELTLGQSRLPLGEVKQLLGAYKK
jgi:hypothetical protein